LTAGLSSAHVSISRLAPTVGPQHTFIHLMVIASQSKNLQMCSYFFDEMRRIGIKPQTIHYNMLLLTSGRTTLMPYTMKIFEDMTEQGPAQSPPLLCSHVPPQTHPVSCAELHSTPSRVLWRSRSVLCSPSVAFSQQPGSTDPRRGAKDETAGCLYIAVGTIPVPPLSLLSLPIHLAASACRLPSSSSLLRSLSALPPAMSSSAIPPEFSFLAFRCAHRPSLPFLFPLYLSLVTLTVSFFLYFSAISAHPTFLSFFDPFPSL